MALAMAASVPFGASSRQTATTTPALTSIYNHLNLINRQPMQDYWSWSRVGVARKFKFNAKSSGRYSSLSGMGSILREFRWHTHTQRQSSVRCGIHVNANAATGLQVRSPRVYTACISNNVHVLSIYYMYEKWCAGTYIYGYTSRARIHTVRAHLMQTITRAYT